MTDEELKAWAEAHSQGPMRSPLAAGVLRLLGEIAAVTAANNELVRENNHLRTQAKAAAVRLQIAELGNAYLCRRLEAGRPAPEDESHLSAPSLASLADDGCPHAGEPD